MKNKYTLFRLFAVFSFLFLLSVSDAKAQITTSVCSFENDCFFVAYEAIQEESPTSPTLLVVLSAFLNEGGTCNDIDGLIFAPVGGTVVLLSREQLAANSTIEFTVDRASFTATPDIIISPYEIRTISIPFFNFSYTGPFPLPPIVDLQARLDSNEPCLPITPLAVELISFTGLPTESGINLNWSTASEENNSHFEVERSADGTTFEQIGKVDGHGNSATTIDYTFIDPAPHNGENYYRLRQVDFDGQFEYSMVIGVTSTAPDAMQVVMYPNPCRGGDCEVLIRTSKAAQETLLELKDMSGRVVLSKRVQNGVAQLTPEDIRQHKGFFILTATSGNEVVHQRVVLE
ncbi:T9SS type A sorting domain-containing protein [uncultured Pontibacter sp.]|uniref:T9SS type A sorting domain-containing protein n=1 Tax=uncultured Pontibacter sp. TaxID=453356 RepID=UPI0026377E75|nr:T9SS type A sorting domain-containing protein [uncultured Pontibacter sp.]